MDLPPEIEQAVFVARQPGNIVVAARPQVKPRPIRVAKRPSLAAVAQRVAVEAEFNLAHWLAMYRRPCGSICEGIGMPLDERQCVLRDGCFAASSG